MQHFTLWHAKKVLDLQINASIMTRKAGKHGTGISYAYIHGRQGNTRLLQLADGTGLNPSLQTRKFGGKELDLTHGYVNYDFGARGYNPLLSVWDRMDLIANCGFCF